MNANFLASVLYRLNTFFIALHGSVCIFFPICLLFFDRPISIGHLAGRVSDLFFLDLGTNHAELPVLLLVEGPRPSIPTVPPLLLAKADRAGLGNFVVWVERLGQVDLCWGLDSLTAHQ